MPDRSEIPAFVNAVNLASAGLGARGVFATDQFFAPLGRMLEDKPAEFIPDKYDDHGKWMDGWESKRRRGPGHDWAIIRLCVPGKIAGFDVDTKHFTGNQPESCRIEAARLEADPTDDGETIEWVEILPQTTLDPDAHHFLASTDTDQVFTHIRMHIYPDGGVARLRAFGEPWLDPAAVQDRTIDLASALNGARVVGYSDAHYGAFYRMLAPGRGRDMGDGWETKRRRGPGHDWILVRLAARGKVGSVTVDTAHYKGNYPDRCSIQGIDLGDFSGPVTKELVEQAETWPLIMDEQKLMADHIHDFGPDKILDHQPITHIRLNIFPDGGVSRLRIMGRLAD